MSRTRLIRTHDARRAGTARRRAAGAVVVAVVVPLLGLAGAGVGAAPAADQEPLDPADGANALQDGQEITVDRWAEPEFLLRAGVEEWNLRQTPDGTVGAAYGRNPAAAHDHAMSSVRSKGPGLRSAKLLDVGVLRANDERGTWAVARYDDGVLEVWNKQEAALDEAPNRRWVLSIDGEDLVGGIVVDEAPDADGVVRPVTVVLTRDGHRGEFVGETGQVLHNRIVPEDAGNVVAAIPRSIESNSGSIVQEVRSLKDEDQPEYGSGNTRQGPFGRPTDGDKAYLFAVTTSGYVFRSDLEVSGFSGAPVASLGGGAFAADAAPVVDIAFSCNYLYRLKNPMYPRLDDLGFRSGSLSLTLGCDNSAIADRNEPLGDAAVTLGNLAVAHEVPGTEKVNLVQVSDLHKFPNLHNPLPTDNIEEMGFLNSQEMEELEPELCTLDSPARYGSFDVRVAVMSIHAACIGVSSGGDALRIQEYSRISTGHYVGSTTSSDSTEIPERGVLGYPVRHHYDRWGTGRQRRDNRTVSVAGKRALLGVQATPDNPNPALTVDEAYTDLDQPVVQLQLPCEALLARPTSSGRDFWNCTLDHALGDRNDGVASNDLHAQEPSARNPVAFTVAGYGKVNGEDRTFVSTFGIGALAYANADDRCLLTPLLFEQPVNPSCGGDRANIGLFPAEQYGATVEPQKFLADDLDLALEIMQCRYEGGSDCPSEPAALDVYSTPGGARPPLVLAHVPRPEITPVKIKIRTYLERKDKPTVPVAVLQAPPIVAGLGQWDADTPEFAASTSTETETSEATESRLGAHFDGRFTAGIEQFKGGIQVDYDFETAVEESLAHTLTVENVEGYGGSFTDHVVITKSVSEHVWEAEVIEDPTGRMVGRIIEFGLPAGEVVQGKTLSALAEESPLLYGPDGSMRPSLDLILAGRLPEDDEPRGVIVPGNPGTYPTGVEAVRPTTPLRSGGGACVGGYPDPDDEDQFTPVDGDLPTFASGTDPYSSNSMTPKGPSIVWSAKHSVDLGSDLTESASILLGTAETQSRVTTKSHDFAAGLAFEGTIGAANAGADWAVTAQLTGGFSHAVGSSQTLGTGSEISAVIGSIPHASEDFGLWLERERYDWRMYMCQAQLGPAGLGATVWVQGYLVDGYAGFGGIQDLAPVITAEPAPGDVVTVDPGTAFGAADGGAVTTPDFACTGSPAVGSPEFGFDEETGTVGSYRIQVENAETGERITQTLVRGQQPLDVADAPREECIRFPELLFPEGDRIRWRLTAGGFVGNEAVSEWATFRAQTIPSGHTVEIRNPLIHSDDTVAFDIVDPPDVHSFKHRVMVKDADGVVVEEASRVGGYYRTGALPVGDYTIEVVGYNGHRDESGERITTPVANTPITIDERLIAQFEYDGCLGDPCSTEDDITFTDISRLAMGDVPITSWLWDFGDGTTSTEQNPPAHRYAAQPPDGADSYPVKLFVTDAMGNGSRYTLDLPFGPPQADLVVGGEGGGTVALDDETSFKFAVDNQGPHRAIAEAGKPVELAVELPPGMTATGAAGDGWDCTLAATTVCTRTAEVASGAAAPPLTVRAEVGDDAVPVGEVVARVDQSVDTDPDPTSNAAAVPFEVAFTRFSGSFDAMVDGVSTRASAAVDVTGRSVCIELDASNVDGVVSGLLLTADGPDITPLHFPVGDADRDGGGSVSVCADLPDDSRDALLARAAASPESVTLVVFTEQNLGGEISSPLQVAEPAPEKDVDPVRCAGQVATIVGTPGDDVIEGTPGPDVIHGLGGDDVVRGLGGDDVICGGGGHDKLVGGAGDDIIKGDRGKDTLKGGGGEDLLKGGGGKDTLKGGGRADVLKGGGGDDVLVGGGGHDILKGGGGGDELYGSNGRDRLRGGGGDDHLNGGKRRDRLHGGNGRDSCVRGPVYRSCEIR